MKTIREIINYVTDYRLIMDVVRNILQDIDPEYLEEERAFREGVAIIKARSPESMPISIDEVINAQEKRIAGNMIYLIWSGLHLNLDCFRDFTKRSFLE